ncbi:pyrroline-5-carboxylate reductase [Thalassotalea ponticola]|uniref:pyrroline-5-carboxylate reductase n=1 Tax=Thalassotalea ponticola TaxID=1523392 RepID=UPI0025B4C104|nr:pyrroline-5-carboxylate reductase [Thalassotalea ponticola]MDN3652099.1 pyrroline-5-carboxylate reductase [Thalassotalea ponticola]
MKNVAFIGAGNMNRCILIGMVNGGFDANTITVTNPSSEKREALAKEYGVSQTSDNLAAAEKADIIILGVKPHLIKEVCKQISEAVDVSKKCFVSVAAGVSVAQMRSVLGPEPAIVRCMPNTPSQLGFGMSGLYADDNTADETKQYIDAMFASVGKTQWLNNEEEIDNLITVSGSGPAYFFAFMEAMQKQAMDFGFDQHTARQLVQQTALGAAQMAVHNSESLTTLRENVTSKGGTTHAALTTLAEGGLEQLVAKAMVNCKKRAQQMTEDNN